MTTLFKNKNMQNKNNKFDVKASVDNQWCPGCGNFPILQTLKKSLTEIDVPLNKLTLVSGVGQASKLPQYLKCNYFNGLHGRSLPVATGIKAANPELTVVVTDGDGGIYGEGGNHLIHAIRRNPNITLFVHNNMTYGLTKGQASPTSQKGLVTKLQPDGVYNEPMNSLAMAISLGASFVARANAGDPIEMQSIFKEAILHKGFSIVDVLQPCVVFNKTNTYKWFKENSFYVEDDYELNDKTKAFEKVCCSDKLALGVVYRDAKKKTFEDSIGVYEHDDRPLHKRSIDFSVASKVLAGRR